MEVDLAAPLISSLTVLDFAQMIEYEGLHLIYFKCGIYRHKGDECPCLEAKAVESKTPKKQDRPKAMEESKAKSPYGPWMLPSYVRLRQAIKANFHDRPQQRSKERDGIRVDLDPLPSGGPNGEQVGSQFRSNWARKDMEGTTRSIFQVLQNFNEELDQPVDLAQIKQKIQALQGPS